MYSLRTLFLVTTLIAAASVIVARPNEYAILYLPIMFAVSLGFGICRAFSSDPATRKYWAIFASVFLAYMLAALMCTLVDFVIAGRIHDDRWQEMIRPMWQSLHGEMPRLNTNTAKGYDLKDVAAFVSALHLVFALLIASASSFFFTFRYTRANSEMPRG